ncbi:RHS repeat domain-containing protein [Cysteiniphilum halobium]|uniref:RHS repeat domain-containing protein n=1 Tax=Cysteiniphilum halobium TaxID=2219059 RepID=UPI000E64C494|nr:RHS repeat-associated core domain-containing protein [Cysteiniphilum halobium]
MLNNKSKLCIGMIMSCLLITQSIAYSLGSIKSVDKQSVNHRSVLVSSAIHYTANGNISMDNQGASFSYNAANELTQVSLASGAKEGDYYYANGLRSVAQNSTKVLVHYYSRHNQLLNTSDGAQQSSTYLITNNAVVRSVNGNATVLLRNRHGSVIGQLGDNPQFYQYSVYGVQRTEDRGQKTDHESGSLALAINPLRYSSYMFDPLTGLYYLKTRDYDPGLRSFMQADSYAFNNHRLINGYFYGNSNPLMVVDPSGHMGVFHEDTPKLRQEISKLIKVNKRIQPVEEGIEMQELLSPDDLFNDFIKRGLPSKESIQKDAKEFWGNLSDEDKIHGTVEATHKKEYSKSEIFKTTPFEEWQLTKETKDILTYEIKGIEFEISNRSPTMGEFRAENFKTYIQEHSEETIQTTLLGKEPSKEYLNSVILGNLSPILSPIDISTGERKPNYNQYIYSYHRNREEIKTLVLEYYNNDPQL